MSSSKTLPKRPVQRKIFTPAEANATLPLVSAIVSDLVDLSRELTERRQRLALLMGGKASNSHDPYQEELVQVQKDMEKDALRLRDYVEELRALGVEPKSGTEGLVDFPALLNGRKVYLCWKLGESRVLFWHDLEAGYIGRQPLRPDCEFQSEEDHEDPRTGWRRRPELERSLPTWVARLQCDRVLPAEPLSMRSRTFRGIWRFAGDRTCHRSSCRKIVFRITLIPVRHVSDLNCRLCSALRLGWAVVLAGLVARGAAAASRCAHACQAGCLRMRRAGSRIEFRAV